MTEPIESARPTVAGRIGITLLGIYLFGVTLRIGGCYAPDAARRDELPDNGPAVGAEFPPFRLRDEELRDEFTAVGIRRADG